MRNLILVLSITLFLSISCSTNSTEPETKELLNTEWQLKSINVNGEITSPAKNRIHILRFTSDSCYSGVSDCNRISGSYILTSESKLDITRLATTYVYCGEESIDDKFNRSLLKSHSYSITGNTLKLYYDSKSYLSFIAH